MPSIRHAYLQSLVGDMNLEGLNAGVVRLRTAGAIVTTLRNLKLFADGEIHYP
jgi:hypothetical protein